MDIGMLENKVGAFVDPIGVGITGKAINAAKAARVIVVSNRDASPTGIRLLEMDAMGRVEAI